MRPNFNPILAAALCFAGSLLAAASQAGNTDLADKPLANSTTVAILPNIMLDLDNSGSMVWDYMPDYVRMRSDGVLETWCRSSSGANRAVCEQGDPPYAASAFNKAYYNPNVRYQWPVNADGARRPDGKSNVAYKSPWSAIPSDGYGVQWIDKQYDQAVSAKPCKTVGSADEDQGEVECPRTAPNATIDLANGYPERKWCNAAGVCVSAIKDGAYAYPDAYYPYLKVSFGAPYYYDVNAQWCNQYGKCQSRKTKEFNSLTFAGWQRVDIKPGTTFPLKSPARTDCAGARCTYDEEMTNFATWYAWYRTRAQMAKSSIGHAFVDVRGKPKTGTALLGDPDDASYFHARIGLTTIDQKTINLPIDAFEGKQKTDFFSSLYKAVPSGGTPLRSSLNEVGKMYAGTSKVYADPIEHACQRNFAILATDGYWNGAGSGLGDQDGKAGVTRPSYMPAKEAAAQSTLADVAYYYYHTDLRDDMDNIVPGAGSNAAVDDVASHQHMTTFTLGLGVDGTLGYQPDYKSAKSGDYLAILQGTKNWPTPTANTQETIDDLWHAAVNGRGTYFSAQDPVALEEGMRKALGSIKRTDGSGAAAATSNLQPTAGDNFIYVANYRTQLWDGELSAHTIDLASGAVSATPQWQASVQLRTQVNADGSDTRTIWTSDGSHNLVPFTTQAGGLTKNQQAWFNNAKLSQYDNWSTEQKAGANAATMVSFLRGADPKVGVGAAALSLYRQRDKVLGDFVHSQPVYVQAPMHDFTDDGYQAYKASMDNRDGIVYAAANDGMLHAFNAHDGRERWAYIPPLLLPELWRLADADYENRHRFYLDGPLTVSDANIGGWKTVLIGAMGKGGRGYYALDVTNPDAPKVLWTFTADNNPNVGYTYGTPFITKVGGKWVALLTSGYNNVPEPGKYATADGKGRLFMLDLANGALVATLPNCPAGECAGTVGDPSGLARLNVMAEEFKSDNTAIAAYGGDLHGNLWRFDLVGKSASKLLELGSAMPITAAPEIATIDNRRAVFVGTGRYLGEADLETKGRQVIIGVRDDGNGTVTFPGSLTKQQLTTEGATRTAPKAKMNWNDSPGWYVELTDAGERVAIDPQLYFGTLLVSSVVPTASPCQPGGYSWQYQLDFRTGGAVNKDKPVGLRQASQIVGNTVSKLPDGTAIIHRMKDKDPVPDKDTFELKPQNNADNTRRALWRELGK